MSNHAGHSCALNNNTTADCMENSQGEDITRRRGEYKVGITELKGWKVELEERRRTFREKDKEDNSPLFNTQFEC